MFLCVLCISVLSAQHIRAAQCAGFLALDKLIQSYSYYYNAGTHAYMDTRIVCGNDNSSCPVTHVCCIYIHEVISYTDH